MLDVLFQDSRYAVVNKPAGLPVHAGPQQRPNVEDSFPELSRRRTGPWLAHRLDADTAGCLIIALRKAALVEAQALFANGQVQKIYWAIVQGTPPQPDGVVDAPLYKRQDTTGWRMIVRPDGLPARTSWRLRGTAGSLSWLELQPQTGRTHQVRVHCAALGCPVAGDAIYGAGIGALQLLARSIRLPITPELTATAPVPPHMQRDLAACGWDDLSNAR